MVKGTTIVGLGAASSYVLTRLRGAMVYSRIKFSLHAASRQPTAEVFHVNDIIEVQEKCATTRSIHIRRFGLALTFTNLIHV